MTALAIYLGGMYLYFFVADVVGVAPEHTLTGIVYVMLTGTFVAHVWAAPRRRRFHTRWPLLAFVALLGWIVASWLLLSYPDPHAAFRMSFVPFTMIAPFFAGARLDIESDVGALARRLLWLALGLVALTLVWLLRHGLPHGERVTPVETWNPISQAVVLCVGAIVAWDRLTTATGRRRWALIGFVGTALFLIFLTGSRGPLIALFVAIALHTVLPAATTTSRRRLVSIGAAAAIASIAISQLPQEAFGRYDVDEVRDNANVDLNSYLQRADAFESAVELYEEYPIAGVGVGNFVYRSWSGLDYPHNLILEAMSELGSIGLLLVLALVMAGLAAAIPLLRGRGLGATPAAQLVAACFVFTLCETMISGSVELDGSFWFWLGAVLNCRFAAEPPT